MLLGRTVLREGDLKVERLRLRLPDGADVLPYDPWRRCALTVRPFARGVFEIGGGDTLEEACLGIRSAEEPPDAAVRREARKELGLTLRTLEPIAEIWSGPGVSTERVCLYLAAYASTDRTAPGGGAPGEHEGVDFWSALSAVSPKRDGGAPRSKIADPGPRAAPVRDPISSRRRPWTRLRRRILTYVKGARKTAC
jgi:8-oxo-dGTP pyrophosphatase MutT (NUDIX family)